MADITKKINTNKQICSLVLYRILSVLTKYARTKQSKEAIIKAKFETAKIVDCGNSQSLAKTCMEYAPVQREKGNIEASKALSIKALDIYMALNKESNDDSFLKEIAICLKQAGNYFWETNELEISEAYYNQALDINLKLFGEHDKNTAKVYRNLGRLYYETNRLEKAIETLNLSMKIFRDIDGYDSLEVAPVCINLSKTYLALKDVNKANEFADLAIEITVNNTKFNDNEFIANAWNNKGIILQEQKMFKDALELHLKSHEIYKTLYGNKHLKYAKTKKMIADCIRHKYPEAADFLYLQTLEIYKTIESKNKGLSLERYKKCIMEKIKNLNN